MDASVKAVQSIERAVAAIHAADRSKDRADKKRTAARRLPRRLRRCARMYKAARGEEGGGPSIKRQAAAGQNMLFERAARGHRRDRPGGVGGRAGPAAVDGFPEGLRGADPVRASR